ncbi:MAG: helix-turn-helix domain-containing protein [Deltaproteobacteria bacterium]|nr:helix-turn-helix domain-containing protein [Deltaproteobacteria bacterium]
MSPSDSKMKSATLSSPFTTADGATALLLHRPPGSPIESAQARSTMTTSTKAERGARSTAEIAPPHTERRQQKWLNYEQASAYTGWSVGRLRNMVSAGQIPVYGKKGVRRFRADMLDAFLSDPDVAMRKFRLERNTHGD